MLTIHKQMVIRLGLQWFDGTIAKEGREDLSQSLQYLIENDTPVLITGLPGGLALTAIQDGREWAEWFNEQSDSSG